ncbi:MAG TPA: enoyl-CoA hydratase/isomerase family protein [Mycobacteriales bacterium]|nr:enoyl-CoA hydratase/isomerase family protein [Mycobacteriales bacterium]
MTTETFEARGVRLAIKGGVARLTLCRPDRRNAQTPSMWAAMAEIGASLPAPVRVVVLAGEGSSFSAGLDRRMLSPDGVPGEPSLDLGSRSDADAADGIDVYQQGFTWLRDPRFISIAAVQGHAIGAGFQLALHCDIRIATEDVQFCMFEPALGLVPDLGGTQLLLDAVGYAKAIEICATARRVGAEEAERSGLANLVVAGGDLAGAIDDLVAALMTTNHEAVIETKRLLLGARNREYDDQRRAERETQVQRLRALLSPAGA